MIRLARQLLRFSNTGIAVMLLGVLAACGASDQTTATPNNDTRAVVASEWGLQGSGDETTDPMELTAGSATVTCTYQGAGDFGLDIVDASGKVVHQLSSPGGTNCSGMTYDLPKSGTYTLHISADGPWEINVTSAGADGVTEVR